MSKGFVKAGSIISLVLNSLGILGSFFLIWVGATLIMLGDNVTTSAGGVVDLVGSLSGLVVVWLALFMLGLYVLMTVFSALAVKHACSNSPQLTGRGIIIFVIVMNFLFALSGIYSTAMAIYSGDVMMAASNIVTVLVYVLASVFLIIGIVKSQNAVSAAPVGAVTNANAAPVGAESTDIMAGTVDSAVAEVPSDASADNPTENK